MEKQIEARGYFEPKSLSMKTWFVLGGIFGGMIVTFFLTGILNRTDIFFGGLLSIPVVIIFGLLMSKKTKEGMEIYWQIKCYKHYIDVAEKHREEWQAKENIFAKTLPYAMVFGNIKKWSKVF